MDMKVTKMLQNSLSVAVCTVAMNCKILVPFFVVFSYFKVYFLCA